MCELGHRSLYCKHLQVLLCATELLLKVPQLGVQLAGIMCVRLRLVLC